MAITNNSITSDIDNVRSERLLRLSHNIDTYAAAIGVDGELLIWAQGANAAWSHTRALAGVERGTMTDMFEDLNLYLDETYRYYTLVKSLLTTIIKQHGGEFDDLIKRYDIDGGTPQNYRPLTSCIDAFLAEDARLRALVPPDPRVVSQAFVDELTARRAKVNQLYQKAYDQKAISLAATANKRRLFKEDSLRLAIILSQAKLEWGDDLSTIQLLGFCPKSKIWTKKRPPSPKNFRYDSADEMFKWDVVDGATEYELECRLAKTTGAWTQLYKGAENHTDAKPATSGTYDCRIRAWKDDVEGRWSAVIVVDLSV